MERMSLGKRWSFSLRGALTLLFLLMPSIAIGLVTVFAVLSYRKAQRDALVEEADTILALLVQHHPAISESAAGANERLSVWSHRVAELPARQPRIRYAELIDTKSADLSHGQISTTGKIRVTPEVPVVDPSYFGFGEDPPIAHVAKRIPDAPGAIVRIGLAAGPGWAHLAHLHDIAAVLLITLAINVWIVRRGLGYLLTPLEDVAKESVALAQGQTAQPVPVRGPAEIQHVARAFNNMLERAESDGNEIKRTLEQLQDQRAAAEFQRQRFVAMVEALHEGLILLGADGQVAYVNPEAGRILGQMPEDLCKLKVPREHTEVGDGDPRGLLSALIGQASWRKVEASRHLDLALVRLDGASAGVGGADDPTA